MSGLVCACLLVCVFGQHKLAACVRLCVFGQQLAKHAQTRTSRVWPDCVCLVRGLSVNLSAERRDVRAPRSSPQLHLTNKVVHGKRPVCTVLV